MQIKDNVFLFPPESGLCFLEGPGGRGQGCGQYGSISWTLYLGSGGGDPGTAGLPAAAPRTARGCERTKQLRAEEPGCSSDRTPPLSSTSWLNQAGLMERWLVLWPGRGSAQQRLHK